MNTSRDKEVNIFHGLTEEGTAKLHSLINDIVDKDLDSKLSMGRWENFFHLISKLGNKPHPERLEVLLNSIPAFLENNVFVILLSHKFIALKDKIRIGLALIQFLPVLLSRKVHQEQKSPLFFALNLPVKGYVEIFSREIFIKSVVDAYPTSLFDEASSITRHPLKIALDNDFSSEIITFMIQKCPKILDIPINSDQWLPIHYACTQKVDSVVINTMLSLFPHHHSIDTKDGKNPLKLALESSVKFKENYAIVVALNEFSHSLVKSGIQEMPNEKNNAKSCISEPDKEMKKVQKINSKQRGESENKKRKLAKSKVIGLSPEDDHQAQSKEFKPPDEQFNHIHKSMEKEMSKINDELKAIENENEQQLVLLQTKTRDMAKTSADVKAKFQEACLEIEVMKQENYAKKCEEVINIIHNVRKREKERIMKLKNDLENYKTKHASSIEEAIKNSNMHFEDKIQTIFNQMSNFAALESVKICAKQNELKQKKGTFKVLEEAIKQELDSEIKSHNSELVSLKATVSKHRLAQVDKLKKEMKINNDLILSSSIAERIGNINESTLKHTKENYIYSSQNVLASELLDQLRMFVAESENLYDQLNSIYDDLNWFSNEET